MRNNLHQWRLITSKGTPKRQKGQLGTSKGDVNYTTQSSEVLDPADAPRQTADVSLTTRSSSKALHDQDVDIAEADDHNSTSSDGSSSDECQQGRDDRDEDDDDDDYDTLVDSEGNGRDCYGPSDCAVGNDDDSSSLSDISDGHVALIEDGDNSSGAEDDVESAYVSANDGDEAERIRGGVVGNRSGATHADHHSSARPQGDNGDSTNSGLDRTAGAVGHDDFNGDNESGRREIDGRDYDQGSTPPNSGNRNGHLMRTNCEARGDTTMTTLTRQTMPSTTKAMTTPGRSGGRDSRGGIADGDIHMNSHWESGVPSKVCRHGDCSPAERSRGSRQSADNAANSSCLRGVEGTAVDDPHHDGQAARFGAAGATMQEVTIASAQAHSPPPAITSSRRSNPPETRPAELPPSPPLLQESFGMQARRDNSCRTSITTTFTALTTKTAATAAETTAKYAKFATPLVNAFSKWHDSTLTLTSTTAPTNYRQGSSSITTIIGALLRRRQLWQAQQPPQQQPVEPAVGSRTAAEVVQMLQLAEANGIQARVFTQLARMQLAQWVDAKEAEAAARVRHIQERTAAAATATCPSSAESRASTTAGAGAGAAANEKGDEDVAATAFVTRPLPELVAASGCADKRKMAAYLGEQYRLGRKLLKLADVFGIGTITFSASLHRGKRYVRLFPSSLLHPLLSSSLGPLPTFKPLIAKPHSSSPAPPQSTLCSATASLYHRSPLVPFFALSHSCLRGFFFSRAQISRLRRALSTSPILLLYAMFFCQPGTYERSARPPPKQVEGHWRRRIRPTRGRAARRRRLYAVCARGDGGARGGGAAAAAGPARWLACRPSAGRHACRRAPEAVRRGRRPGPVGSGAFVLCRHDVRAAARLKLGIATLCLPGGRVGRGRGR